MTISAPGQDGFAEKVYQALADPTKLPPEFRNWVSHYAAQNAPPIQTVRAPAVLSTGLGDAIQGTRYVGATTSGSPTTGYFKKGDFCVDQSGAMWVCTASGDPGTWVSVGASAGTSLPCCFLDTVTSFTLTPWSGVYTDVTWTNFSTNDNTVFSWSNGSPTDLTISKTGVYRFVYEYQTSGTDFPTGPNSILSTVNVTASGHTNETLSINLTSGAAFRGDPSAGTPWGPIGEKVANIIATGTAQLFMAWDGGSGSATIEAVNCFAYRLGDAV